MEKRKSYRPKSLVYIIFLCITLIIICCIGGATAYWLIVSDILYAAIGGFSFIILTYTIIKVAVWKIKFTEQYIFIPNNKFDVYVYSVKQDQKIHYSDIDEIVTYKDIPIIFLKGKDLEIGTIYIKRYSNRQVNDIIKEIEIRTNRKVTRDK
jgi:uncharacterized protein (DUF486 family)